MKKSVTATAMALLLLGTHTAASAEIGKQSTLYAGAAVVDSDFDIGFRLFGGYEFMDFALGQRQVYVAGELAYTDFGEDSVGFTTISAKGFSATAVGRMPIVDRLEVFAKLGLARLEVEAPALCIGICIPGTEVKDTKTGLTAGVGAKYGIANQIAVFAAVDHYDFGGQTGKDFAFSVGGEFRF
jgi:opacity protein-like surface antigen